MCRSPAPPYNKDMETLHLPAATGQLPPAPMWSVGGRFVDALCARDFDAMAACLDASVRFRGLIPPGPFEVVGPDAVMTLFRRWFGGPDVFEMLDATVGEVGPKLYLRWRVTMTPASPAAPTRLAEQHLFVTIDRRIVALDLLCSGFSDRPAAPLPSHLSSTKGR